MLHRALAVLGYPAYLLNAYLDGPLGRLGLRRLPGALLVAGIVALLTITTATATFAAYDARPEALSVSIAEITDGHIGSGLWVEFPAELVDGPERAIVQVSAGGGQSTDVERVYYLVADPDAPDRAVIIRYPQPIGVLDASDGPVVLDGTITEDSFNVRTLLQEWNLAERHPDVEFSENRLIAYAFETPWQEPSWVGTGLLGAVALILIGGAFIDQPIFRSTGPTPAPGTTPIRLAIHGSLPTPRGPVRLRGTAAQLEWMNVEDVARTRWRYWGAGLGDVRRDVEEAVQAHGLEGERLVVHGPTGSVIWPIEPGTRLEVEAGEAYVGLRRLPALRVRGGGASATLTFAASAGRDAAAAELAPG